MSKFAETNKKIADIVTEGYKTIENTAVGTYKKIETTVVGTYQKIEDKFVENILTHDGETVEEAKMRIKNTEEK